MKLLNIIIFFTLSLNVLCQTTYIPDDNFELLLIDLGYDDVFDNYVQTSSIDLVTVLDFPGGGIADLTGVEDFASLTHLNVKDNLLNYELDLTENSNLIFIDCSMNSLTDINISGLNQLDTLKCFNNIINNLNLSFLTNISFVECFNNSISYINFNSNTNLEYLHCGSNNLNIINLLECPNLKLLDCAENQLTNLDLNYNLNLEYLNCEYNSLTNLDVSNNQLLKRIHCYDNFIQSIMLCQNYNLVDLDCHGNPTLSELDIRNGNNYNMFNYITYLNPNLECINSDESDELCDYNFIDNCMTSYNCQNGLCVNTMDGQGQFAIFNDCLENCDIIPSWDCVNNACVDPMDGTGEYTSNDDCLKNCGSIDGSGQYCCLNGFCIESIALPFQNSEDCIWFSNLGDCAANCKYWSTSIENTDITKKVIKKIINTHGQEKPIKENILMLYIYDDGSVEKKIIIE